MIPISRMGDEGMNEREERKLEPAKISRRPALDTTTDVQHVEEAG